MTFIIVHWKDLEVITNPVARRTTSNQIMLSKDLFLLEEAVLLGETADSRSRTGNVQDEFKIPYSRK